MIKSLAALLPMLLGVAGAGVAVADGKNTLITFNGVEELLAGDVDDTTNYRSVKEILKLFPAHYILSGTGTTNTKMDNGEVIVLGTAGKPELYWVHGDKHTFEAINDEDLQFAMLSLAVVDPTTKTSFTISDGSDLYGKTSNAIKKLNVPTAAVRLFGKVSDAKLAMAKNFTKEGVNLKDKGSVKKAIEFYDYKNASDWMMSAVYSGDESIQRLIEVAGVPVHIHGLCKYCGLGGHIVDFGRYELEVDVYPIRQTISINK